MLKKIEKPDVSTHDFNRWDLLSNEAISKLINKSFKPYSYWTKIKYWETPSDVTHKEIWSVIKFIRKNDINRKKTIFQDEQGNFFSWMRIPGFDELLHQIDMDLGGNLMTSISDGEESFRHQLLSRGIIEEAIASSQLEGAHTTRKVAKQMIIEGRKPRSQDGQMILNNYEAMQYIEQELVKEKLSEDVLLELHQILTKKTSLIESEIGRYRNDQDGIVVGNRNPNEIVHIPPKENFLKKEIKKFVDYANDNLKDSVFVHPIIKAIILHFWFGYLHPFVDGNGRMARALFYWYLLKNKYWAFGYLPLSKIIKKSPVQYQDAYVYSEQDDNDLTYFVDYNMRMISQAMSEFEEYKKTKWSENSRMSKRAKQGYGLNERQTQLLRYLYKNRDESTSITTHMKIQRVARMTARKDLIDLEKIGFLTSKKIGRVVHYYSTAKVEKLFK